MNSTEFTELMGRLQRCRSVLFITGAGLSADSGLATYRGIGGLYEDGVGAEGVPVEVALSGEMLTRDPILPWRHISQIEQACRSAGPNEGHRVIAEAESAFERVWTLTQNIDGFHSEAGSKHVIEIHGNLHNMLCTECGEKRRVTDYEELTIPPACAKCNGLMRPGVVLFGEALPSEAVKELSYQLSEGFDAVFTIGTTSVFPYIAEPIRLARYWNALSVEINPGKSEVSHDVDFRIRAGAAETLKRIWDALNEPSCKEGGSDVR